MEWPGVVTGRTRLRASGRKECQGPGAENRLARCWMEDRVGCSDVGLGGVVQSAELEFIPGALGKYWRAFKINSARCSSWF